MRCRDCGQDLQVAEDGVSFEHVPGSIKCHTLVPEPEPIDLVAVLESLVGPITPRRLRGSDSIEPDEPPTPYDDEADTAAERHFRS